MNPYESPPEQQSIPLANEAPEPEPDEQPSVRTAIFRVIGAIAITGLALFLAVLIWAAAMSVAPPN